MTSMKIIFSQKQSTRTVFPGPFFSNKSGRARVLFPRMVTCPMSSTWQPSGALLGRGHTHNAYHLLGGDEGTLSLERFGGLKW